MRLTELKQIDQEIHQSEHAQAIAEYEELIRRSQTIRPQIELLTRYEKHINRTLYEALDRLMPCNTWVKLEESNGVIHGKRNRVFRVLHNEGVR